jgi:tetratricopeptide (TPR) repeat protein
MLEINRGIANGVLGNDREAENHFIRGLQLAPGDALPPFYYGRWMHQRHRIPEAVQLLRSAIGKNPDYLDARYELMRVFADAGMTKELQALTADTLRIVPGDPTALLFGQMPTQGAIPVDTVGKAEIAVRERATPENFLNLSLAYSLAGKFRESIDAAQRALKLRPEYAEAWNNVAAGYESLGEWDAAIQAAESAIKLKPDFQLARNNLAYSKAQKLQAANRAR